MDLDIFRWRGTAVGIPGGGKRGTKPLVMEDFDGNLPKRGNPPHDLPIKFDTGDGLLQPAQEQSANTPFQSLRRQGKAPEDQFAPTCPSIPNTRAHRDDSCYHLPTKRRVNGLGSVHHRCYPRNLRRGSYHVNLINYFQKKLSTLCPIFDTCTAFCCVFSLHLTTTV